MEYLSSNWCGRIVCGCLTVLCVILCLDYNYSILPVNGILLCLYLLAVFVSSIWLTFTCVQGLLKHNKPLELDLENNKYLSLLKRMYDLLYKPSDMNTADTQVFSPVSMLNEHEVYDYVDSTVFQPAQSNKINIPSKNIDDRINDFVEDIERLFVIRWYWHISGDETFPCETKALLDEVIRRFLQVVVEIDSKKMVHGILAILLKHLKEFRKTLKRVEKNGGTVEDTYRYVHVGSNSQKALEHFVHRLTTNVLRQFITWDLWNSLPCRTLISILARKVFTLILIFVSSPGFINYKILQRFSSDVNKTSLKLNEFSFVSLSNIDLSIETDKEKKDKLTNEGAMQPQVKYMRNTYSSTPKISPKRVVNAFVGDDSKTAPEEIKSETTQLEAESIKNITSAAVSGTGNGEPHETEQEIDQDVTRPKPSEPVKIYESTKSAHKTWRNSSDLECISLGQDLLALQEISDPDSQIQDLIEKKLWKDTTDSVDDEKTHSIWDTQESWYGEEDGGDITDAVIVSHPNLHSYLKSTTNAASIITNTIKPIAGNVTASTIHNMKELQQTTVNTVNSVVKPVSQATHTAMHKIGDLQDEAAGVVEGILDFGMAGIRKGLRLTGLQENFSELTQRAKFELGKQDAHKPTNVQKPTKDEEIRKVDDPNKKIEHDSDHHRNSAGKLIKTPHVASEDINVDESSVWMNPLTKESPSFDGEILLEKTPDSAPVSNVADDERRPDVAENFESLKNFIIPHISEDGVANAGSPDPEYEENPDFATTIAKLRSLLQQKSSESGFTTPSLSPMPQDEINKSTTPLEPIPTDLSKVDGAMPSLYKFCARTATGVFQNTLNTIKTALPGNVNESGQSWIQDGLGNWTFVEMDTTANDFYSQLVKLLSERQAFCSVDTAYEAIDSLEIVDQPEVIWTSSSPQFDDEQDEFDLQIPITKTLVDIVCELVADTNPSLVQEPVVKAVLLLIGTSSEEYVDKLAEKMLCNINKLVGKLPENLDQNVMALKLEKMVQICLENFSGIAKELFGTNTLDAAVKLLITSFQSQRINQDIFMQIFELFASQLIYASSQISPAYSA